VDGEEWENNSRAVASAMKQKSFPILPDTPSMSMLRLLRLMPVIPLKWQLRQPLTLYVKPIYHKGANTLFLHHGVLIFDWFLEESGGAGRVSGGSNDLGNKRNPRAVALPIQMYTFRVKARLRYEAVM